MTDPIFTHVTARTTKIRVRDEIWSVPRGFGMVYRRVLRDHFAGEPGKLISEVLNLLALIGYQASSEQVGSWDLRRCVEAVVYAATEHARASDNPVQRHPRPSWLPERPWQGPEQGEGVFAGPGGTPIVKCPSEQTRLKVPE